MWELPNPPYNLRSGPRTKRKHTFATPSPIGKKRLRSFDHITGLPNEALLNIFSFLSPEDLYRNVRPVCKNWYGLAMLASPWKSIRVGNEIPTGVLKNWIRGSPIIKQLTVSNRNDADGILEAVSKCAMRLESITMENCWGSNHSIYLRSDHLCRLLTKCKKLEKIHFDRIKIRSCKFFKLLASRWTFGKFLQLSYVGPVTQKQYNALRESCSGWIFTEYIEIDGSE